MSRQAASAPHFHKSKTLENKYMLGDEIGKGAYGRVYKGLDLENGDFVAIKQVSLENMPQEDLNVIMNLNHKNIVKYLGSLKTKTHLHIILEYVENGSLANIIKPNKFGPFPESLVALYIAQVLEGLVYLHEQGVIHRDIKGANILTTKEGLVKLADFGVATKLTEADVNTHSVVGTPYWMAPEVIEMSGVRAASDIWSVGCTVIELLTCVPPYYDLQPMPALFRIVQDEHPPIPDWLSPGITDFLHQCFKKDALHRPDAKTLLQHPWILNSRRVLQSSITRNLQQKTLVSLPAEDRVNEESPDEKQKGDSFAFPPGQDLPANDTSLEAFNISKLEGQDMQPKLGQEDDPQPSSTGSEPDHNADQDLTLAIHDNPVPQSSSDKLSPTVDGVTRSVLKVNKQGEHENVFNEGADFYAPKNKNIIIDEHEEKPEFHPIKIQHKPQEAALLSTVSGDPELSRFSDPPGDASLDDLFQSLQRNQEDASVQGSTSSLMDQENGHLHAVGKNDLATKLKSRLDQKRVESEQGNRNGENLLRLMMGVLREDVIDLGSLVVDENLPRGNLLPVQAVEFSRLVSSLKAEQPEDVIVSACQKLIAFFLERPEQKLVFIMQHGLLPLMELLEVPKNRVICCVLQLINQLVKDNSDFLENACLIGLVPVVTNFALPDHLQEIRMQAAFFLQQLCQCSSLTLQMFIACRGIPILVGFLEPDYAKHREMVHLAVDGMWQVFKLQTSTPRNDFCHIAAKNGILIRLVNTLHSLNEATRLASISGTRSILADGNAPQPQSGPLDVIVTPRMVSGQLDPLKVKRGCDHPLSSPSQRSDANLTALSEGLGLVKLPNSENLEYMGTSTKETINTNNDWVIEADAFKQQRFTKLSTDKSHRQVELASNGSAGDQVRPLLSLLEKELPSGRVSGQLESVRHFCGLEISTEKKTNGEQDFLVLEFDEASSKGIENGSIEPIARNLQSETSTSKRTGPYSGPTTSTEGTYLTSGKSSQTTSSVLSGSGVLNARPGSTTSSGLLSQMVATLNADVAKDYLEKVADLLLEFAQADSFVKLYMCNQSLLSRLFQMFTRIEPPILLKILKCINHLSTDPNCLDNLQRADTIKHLIPNLEVREVPLICEMHNEVLNALFNLCKINKRRQEQAAENGIIPHLMHFIMSDSPLKQYALPLLCDMAHASRNSREQLRTHGGLDIYLSLLDDELWSVTALDSVAVCLAHDSDQKRVEQSLLRKEAVQKLVKFFQCCPEQYFVNILEPFLKIVTKSSRINTSLAVNGLTSLLIARLDHQNAIARLTLLKLIKAIYEHHPRPKQLIVENDLPQRLQNLIEERRDGQSFGGQVLVKQMATALLKALHINTVL